MPRIRDLGINVIPATMRPPEIGPGGGFDANPPAAEYPFLLCEDNTCILNSTCAESSAVVCDSSCTGSSARDKKCVASPPGCEGNTCANSCEQASAKKNASGLTDDAVAELKRHLHARIGTQLEN